MKSKYKIISSVITLLYLGAGCAVYVITNHFYLICLGMIFLPLVVHYLLWRSITYPSRTVIVFLEKPTQGTVSEVYLTLWIKPFYKVNIDGGEAVITSKICVL